MRNHYFGLREFEVFSQNWPPKRPPKGPKMGTENSMIFRSLFGSIFVPFSRSRGVSDLVQLGWDGKRTLGTFSNPVPRAMLQTMRCFTESC